MCGVLGQPFRRVRSQAGQGTRCRGGVDPGARRHGSLRRAGAVAALRCRQAKGVLVIFALLRAGLQTRINQSTPGKPLNSRPASRCHRHSIIAHWVPCAFGIVQNPSLPAHLVVVLLVVRSCVVGSFLPVGWGCLGSAGLPLNGQPNPQTLSLLRECDYLCYRGPAMGVGQ